MPSPVVYPGQPAPPSPEDSELHSTQPQPDWFSEPVLTGLLRAHPFQHVASAVCPVPSPAPRGQLPHRLHKPCPHMLLTTQTVGPVVQQLLLWRFLLFVLFPRKRVLEKPMVHSSVIMTVIMPQPAVHPRPRTLGCFHAGIHPPPRAEAEGG